MEDLAVIDGVPVDPAEVEKIIGHGPRPWWRRWLPWGTGAMGAAVVLAGLTWGAVALSRSRPATVGDIDGQLRRINPRR